MQRRQRLVRRPLPPRTHASPPITGEYVIIEFGAVQSGGLGDRLVGLVSAILVAKHSGKKLLIKWVSPNISGVFRIPPQYQYQQQPIPTSLTLDNIDSRYKYRGLLADKNALKPHNILLRCNQEIASFVGATRDEILSTYTTLFRDYLIPINQPRPPLDGKYVAVQLRTGDTYLGVGNRQFVANLTQTVDMLLKYVAQTFPNEKYIYFSTDHPTAKTAFRAGLARIQKEMLETPSSQNIHFERSQAAPLSYLLNDLQCLIAAKALIISSYSNYGRLASLIRGTTDALYGFGENTMAIVPIISLKNLLSNS